MMRPTCPACRRILVMARDPRHRHALLDCLEGVGLEVRTAADVEAAASAVAGGWPQMVVLVPNRDIVADTSKLVGGPAEARRDAALLIVPRCASPPGRDNADVLQLLLGVACTVLDELALRL